MRFNSLIPELTVEDIERTKEFYVGVLHFKVEYERPEDRFAFLSYEEYWRVFGEFNHLHSKRNACHHEQFVYKCSFGLTGIVLGFKIRKIVYIRCDSKLVDQ